MKKINIFKSSIFKIKNHFKKIISLKKSPHAIALGFSVGSFIALFPTFGMAYFIGIGILLIFPTINKFTLFLGVAFWNPFLLAPVYRYSYRVGNYIMGDMPQFAFKFSFNSDMIRMSLRFLLGNIIISLFISLFLYFILFLVVQYFRNRKRVKSKI